MSRGISLHGLASASAAPRSGRRTRPDEPVGVALPASYRAAASAYQRALELSHRPIGLDAYRRVAIDRPLLRGDLLVSRRLHTRASPDTLRFGAFHRSIMTPWHSFRGPSPISSARKVDRGRRRCRQLWRATAMPCGPRSSSGSARSPRVRTRMKRCRTSWKQREIDVGPPQDRRWRRFAVHVRSRRIPRRRCVRPSRRHACSSSSSASRRRRNWPIRSWGLHRRTAEGGARSSAPACRSCAAHRPGLPRRATVATVGTARHAITWDGDPVPDAPWPSNRRNSRCWRTRLWVGRRTVCARQKSASMNA